MGPPLFSVILPTRGDSAHLRASLRSALEGSLPREVLVVHDRRAGERPLPEALGSDPRVRLLESERPGLPGARNTGIAQAAGGLLALMDDDDLWLPGHLEAARTTLASDPGAVLYTCDAFFLDDDTADGSRALPADAGTLPRFRPDLGGPLDLGTLLRGNPIVASAVVLVRDRLPSSRPFDPGLPSLEDYDLWLRLARGGRLLFHPQPLAVIRRRRGAMSRNWRRMAECSLLVLERFLAEGVPEETFPSSERRRRLGGLRHDLAYACLVEDDLPAGRAAARAAIRLRPLRLKTGLYLAASFMPGPLRHLAFGRGRRALSDGRAR